MESSNITKIWQNSRVPRHLKYVGYSDLYSCFSNPEFVANHDELCRFIHMTKDCNELVQIFNYLDYMVCDLKLDKSFKGVVFMLCLSTLIILAYSIVVYVVGRYFIVPNILTLAERWKMADFEFGITALTATITLPAFLETTSSCGENSGNGSMVLAEVMGKLFACFASGFVTFCLKRNFKAKPLKFLFYMLVLIIGLFYVFDVMFFKVANDHLSADQRASFNLTIHAIFSFIIYMVILSVAFFRSNVHRKKQQVEDTISNVDSLSSDEYEDAENPIEYDLDSWALIFKGSSPFNGEVKGHFLFKLFITPIWVVCAFMVPVYTKYRELNGWCKLQAITSFLLFPVCFYYVAPEPLFYASLFVCLLLAVLTIMITHRKQEPPLHELYGVFGIFCATNIYFLIDAEMDSLTWQLLNYLADWKTDVALLLSSPLAQIILVAVFSFCLIDQGHAMMAFGMIVGVAMFFTFTVLPLMVIQHCNSKKTKTTITSSTETSYFYMITIYMMIFFGASMANFELRKSLGIAVLGITVAYIFFTCASASWLLHSYGCEHSLYMFVDGDHANWA